MKLKLVLAVSLLGLPAFPMAQQLYRCGNTYSQTPCAPNATPKRIPTGTAPGQPEGSHGKELCATEGVSLLQFPDPESTRIKSVVKAESEVVQYSGQPLAVHRFNMVINTKNSNGAYTGDRVYPCYLSEDERRVLKVDSQRR